MNSSTPSLRIVRDAGEPLGLFFRVGKSDHTVLKQLLSENRVGMLGAVFDPCHQELSEALKKKLEKSRRKQDGWRATLGELRRVPIGSFAAPIERRIHRALATA